jgi:hypothetical protein
LAEHFDKKPPRGNVEALDTGTLREIETTWCHYDILILNEQENIKITLSKLVKKILNLTLTQLRRQI